MPPLPPLPSPLTTSRRRVLNKTLRLSYYLTIKARPAMLDTRAKLPPPPPPPPPQQQQLQLQLQLRPRRKRRRSGRRECVTICTIDLMNSIQPECSARVAAHSGGSQADERLRYNTSNLKSPATGNEKLFVLYLISYPSLPRLALRVGTSSPRHCFRTLNSPTRTPSFETITRCGVQLAFSQKHPALSKEMRTRRRRQDHVAVADFAAAADFLLRLRLPPFSCCRRRRRCRRQVHFAFASSTADEGVLLCLRLPLFSWSM